MKVKAKSPVIDAWRISMDKSDPNNSVPAWVLGAFMRQDIYVSKLGSGESLYIDNGKGSTTVAAVGDWLMRDVDGSLWSTCDEDFRLFYEVIDA